WPGQERAIDNVLNGKPSVVIMPTGGGKSLCFQLPALVLDGVTIVISPLIALMKDQVDNLKRVGIPATYVNSSISQSETLARLEAVQRGSFKLLYIAPERFYNQEFLKVLTDIKVSLFAVDEAHCISQWGHDFRPSYVRLRDAIELVGSPPVLALTATATPEVRQDIIKQLDLKNPDLVITGFARPNLQFGVVRANEGSKPRIVLEAIQGALDKSGIIYVGTRARADALLQYLLENDIEAVGYHAGMEAEDRKWVQNNFITGQAKIIVATNAFGLGIDKEDVRFVIHYDMPGTVEAYYQEVGRAGRDSQPSFCLLLYNSRDRALHEFFIKGDNPPAYTVREIYEILTSHESDTVLITYSELSEMLSGSMPDMAIGTGLKILEKEGYIARAREKNGNAYLKLNKDYAAVFKSLGVKAKKQRELFSGIYERYGNEINRGWQFIPNEIAEILEVKKESLMRLVRQLKENGLAEYHPPFKGTEIRILKRVNSREIKFDEAAMKAKLKAAYRKLDQIEDYVFDLGCRQKFILDYFGDSQSKQCGQCDVCSAQRGYDKSEADKARGILDTIMAEAEDAPRKERVREKPKKKSLLNTKLTQLETLELYNQGRSIEEMASARELKPETIVNHICFLFEKGVIKDIDKLVDKKVIAKVEKAVEKVGLDKLKPVYEELDGQVDYQDIKLAIAGFKKA
ncbi:MAG: RecQ family ATP-dependent DNA helicase, partial [Candidatus Omnitrophota bacterium]